MFVETVLVIEFFHCWPKSSTFTSKGSRLETVNFRKV